MELRCPDASSNPYLVFALMLNVGLEGIEQKIEAPEPVEENVYHLDEASLKNRNIATLPGSLLEAIMWFQKCELARETLGQDLFNKYLLVKQKEWNDFKTEVCPWELEKYLEIY